MPRRPNFFIVGAPKCGTTSMNDSLAQHPDIFMSPMKEPYFFGSDLDIGAAWRVTDERKYLKLFEDARDEKRVGEASVWYLYSKMAAEEIHRFEPEAKIVVMIRDPVDVVRSLHWQQVTAGNEPMTDLGEALSAEPDRAEGRRLPARCVMPSGLLYRRIADFAPQIERMFGVFGRESVHVVLFDDLKRDTLGTYRKLLGFLNVDPSFEPGLARQNEARRLRNAPVRQMLRRHAWLSKSLNRLPLGLRGLIGNQLSRVYGEQQPDARIEPSLHARLCEELRPGVDRLEELLGVDLRGWCRPNGQGPASEID